MFRDRLLLLIIFIMLFLSNCTRDNVVVQPPKDNSGKKWANETNITALGKDDNLTTTDSKELKDKVLPRVPFPVAQYNRLARRGRATVRGEIYLDDGYGKKIFAKNTRLYLNPVTSYSKQWYNESYIKGYKLTKADVRLYNYLRFTTSDANGKFAFYGVPNGSYYIIGSVNNGANKIRIANEISVRNSKSINTILSRTID
ncbi:hypothetical protein MNB_SV-15-1366 [hydrothermal vent metagenome]|uniref:Carboxypeptidase regulatory-like domain-containing protein n=1 Tax=hydrothermal vent metagenome TaxID=652676 RepID=A0A1W1EHZ7_9ZZZZ